MAFLNHKNDTLTGFSWAHIDDASEVKEDLAEYFLMETAELVGCTPTHIAPEFPIETVCELAANALYENHPVVFVAEENSTRIDYMVGNCLPSKRGAASLHECYHNAHMVGFYIVREDVPSEGIMWHHVVMREM